MIKPSVTALNNAYEGSNSLCHAALDVILVVMLLCRQILNRDVATLLALEML